jgi:hypothetical protein
MCVLVQKCFQTDLSFLLPIVNGHVPRQFWNPVQFVEWIGKYSRFVISASRTVYECHHWRSVPIWNPSAVDPCTRIHTQNPQETTYWLRQEHASQALLPPYGNNDRTAPQTGTWPTLSEDPAPGPPRTTSFKTSRNNNPPPSAIRSRDRSMGQGYSQNHNSNRFTSFLGQKLSFLFHQNKKEESQETNCWDFESGDKMVDPKPIHMLLFFGCLPHNWNSRESQKCRVEKTVIFFLIVLSGKLGPIYILPGSVQQ